VTYEAAAEDAALRVKNIKAFAFDAYGTLFDVFSVTQLCEQLFPGRGNAVAQVWRAKQLHYSLLRSLMGRHRDFWGLTEDGLVFATKSLNLDLTRTSASAHGLVPEFGVVSDVKRDWKLSKDWPTGGDLVEWRAEDAGGGREECGIAHLLDRIISVEEVKIFKVSPRVYNLAAEHFKITNAQVGFISANSWDINGAASAGVTTFGFNAAPPNRLRSLASVQIKSSGDH